MCVAIKNRHEMYIALVFYYIALKNISYIEHFLSLNKTKVIANMHKVDDNGPFLARMF